MITEMACDSVNLNQIDTFMVVQKTDSNPWSLPQQSFNGLLISEHLRFVLCNQLGPGCVITNYICLEVKNLPFVLISAEQIQISSLCMSVNHARVGDLMMAFVSR